nr:MAG TPA: hypothetical protein [Crassvirales sp.]
MLALLIIIRHLHKVNLLIGVNFIKKNPIILYIIVLLDFFI